MGRWDGNRERRRQPALILPAFLIAFLWAADGRAEAPLFGDSGPQVTDVIQGRLGSCFFHASIAALTLEDAAAVAKMIRPGLIPGSYRVTFPDGAVETAYEGDIAYAREKRFDESKALWVTVLFRAYGQRVLRDALKRALEETILPTLVKTPLLGILTSTDILVLAYDRAIRAEIDQDGAVDVGGIKARLREQLQPLPLTGPVKDRFVTLLDSKEFFSTVAQTVKQNGEIFGAYRAIGNGGVPQQVLKAFRGRDISIIHTTSPNVRKALALGVPIIAGTFFAPGVLPRGADQWYVERHAYTVMRFDPVSDTVVLRNPWGTVPGPDGMLTLPFTVFESTFYTLTIAASVAD